MKGSSIAYKHQGTAGMSRAHIEQTAEALSDYRKRLVRIAEGGYEAPESAINLPLDQSNFTSVEKAKGLLKGNLEHVILIGIGGSALGAEAVYHALQSEKKLPKLHVADTANPRKLLHIEEVIRDAGSEEEIAIVIVTKSGSTAETVMNAECVSVLFAKRFGEDALNRRVLVASDHDSPMYAAAEEKEWGRVAIPKTVGGRFSIFSAANLLPLALLGINIKELLQGAADAREACLSSETAGNIALLRAAFLHKAHSEGKVINDHFFFTPELAGLGAWYRQLFAESLGKEKTLNGEVARAGMLPTVTVGSTDLHSVAQLYFGGPQNRATTFVYAKDAPDGGAVPSESHRMFPDILPAAAGKTIADLSTAIREATKAAYKEADMPYTEMILPGLTPKALGAFMMSAMIEVMYLGSLWHVNAFDQPEVERYKSHMRTFFGK